MRTLLSFLICVFIVSCKKNSTINTSFLEGYWEIEKVSSHGETFQPKGAAPLVDYYFLATKQTGFRKKLAPSFGLYQTSDQHFAFEVKNIEGHYTLLFNKALKPWKEKIISLDSTQLILEHQDKVYHYVRHQKIILE